MTVTITTTTTTTLLVLTLLSLTLVSSVFAEVRYGNTQLSEDTMWTEEDSPYIIDGRVVLWEDIYLIVSRGVEVRFTANGILDTSAGTLTAITSSEEPTAFTGYVDDEPVPGGQGVFIIGKASILNVLFAGLKSVTGTSGMPVSFSQCQFIDNGVGLSNVEGSFDHLGFENNIIGADHIYGNVEYSEFTKNSKLGLGVVGKVSHSKFEENHLALKTYTAGSLHNKPLFLTKSVFSSNYQALDLDEENPGLSILQNSFVVNNITVGGVLDDIPAGALGNNWWGTKDMSEIVSLFNVTSSTPVADLVTPILSSDPN